MGPSCVQKTALPHLLLGELCGEGRPVRRQGSRGTLVSQNQLPPRWQWPHSPCIAKCCSVGDCAPTLNTSAYCAGSPQSEVRCRQRICITAGHTALFWRWEQQSSVRDFLLLLQLMHRLRCCSYASWCACGCIPLRYLVLL
jgi:hypothetical protein